MSATDQWTCRVGGSRPSKGARKVPERRPSKAVPGPLVRSDGTDRLVERDRGLVPVEDGPLEPTAVLVESETSQRREQCSSYPKSAVRGPDIEILEIDTGSSRPGGKAPVVQGHANYEVVDGRDPRKDARLRPEQRALECARSYSASSPISSTRTGTSARIAVRITFLTVPTAEARRVLLSAYSRQVELVETGAAAEDELFAEVRIARCLENETG